MLKPTRKKVVFNLPPNTELVSLPVYQEYLDRGWEAKSVSMRLGTVNTMRQVSVTFVRNESKQA